MNIIFFHIPRTAGSSIWNSLANSFSGSKYFAKVDTHNESFTRYVCFNHEEEILKKFLELDVKANFLIHVYRKIKFSDLNYVDLVVFGKRNLFTWRTSIISHFGLGFKKQIACRHPQMCNKKDTFYLNFFATFFLLDYQINI